MACKKLGKINGSRISQLLSFGIDINISDEVSVGFILL